MGIAIEAVAIVCILGIATSTDRLILGGVVVGVSLVLLYSAYRITARRQLSAVTRDDRAMLIWPVNLARSYAGVTLVLSVPAGLAVATVTLAVIEFAVPSYERRILHGELQRELAKTDPCTRRCASNAQ